MYPLVSLDEYLHSYYGAKRVSGLTFNKTLGTYSLDIFDKYKERFLFGGQPKDLDGFFRAAFRINENTHYLMQAFSNVFFDEFIDFAVVSVVTDDLKNVIKFWEENEDLVVHLPEENAKLGFKAVGVDESDTRAGF